MRRDPSQQSGEMGRPPGPHAVPAPAGTTAAGGTTAAPGLIRDLVAWTPCPPRAHPGPRWALMAAAVAAGALMVSCLLCALCCRCRRRPGRKPRDKEAVGLGSPQSSTTTHLVQPEVDGLESSPGGAQKWGCLQLSLEYDFGSQEIRVGLKQAVDLRARDPSGTADPYARISLSAQAGRRHETKVHRGTLCPVFNETCCFHVPPQELPQTTLRVQVLDSRRFSRHEPLGELCLPLGTVGLQHVLEFWHPLGPPSTPELRPADRGGAGGPGPEPGAGRALCEGPARAEPEEVEDEEDVWQEEHGRPVLQRGLHLPRAVQPGPECGLGAGRLGSGPEAPGRAHG
nr:synaptotagmin-8 isoform X4 [Desmodus rotundus]